MTSPSRFGEQASAQEAVWRTRVAATLLVVDVAVALGVQVLPGTGGAGGTGFAFVTAGGIAAAVLCAVVLAANQPTAGKGWRVPLLGVAFVSMALMLFVPLLVVLSLVPDGADGATEPLLLLALAALVGLAVTALLAGRTAIGFFVRHRQDRAKHP